MDQTAVFDFVLRTNNDLVSFALGLPNPDLFPVAQLSAAVESVFKNPGDVYQYANPPEEVREHIVRLMALRGVTCSQEQIVLTNGAQHGIDMAMRLLCGAGRPVVLEDVTYTGALAAVSAGDIPVHTVSATGGAVAGVRDLLRTGVRPGAMYVMPEGHNPLGASMPEPDRHDVVALAREHAFTVIEDDAYGFLQYDDQVRPALRSLEDRWVFYVGSFSKIISPGLRVGWIVVPAGTTVSKPDSGMFFWVELPEGTDTGELLDAAVAEYGVSFVPGDLYLSGPLQGKRNYLRLSFSCVTPADIEAGTERLGKLFRDRGIA